MSLLQVRSHVSKHVWERSRKIVSRVIDFRVGNFKLSGLVMSGERNFYYNPFICADGSFYCDCQGFEATETICSHILAIMRKAQMVGFNIRPWIRGLNGEYNESDYMKIYETSLKSYNKLFGGLQGGRYLSGICSSPELGKSYMNATFCVDMCLKHGKNALVIDTEGGFTPEWIYAIAEDRGAKDGINVEFIDWRVRIGDKGQKIVPVYKHGKSKKNPNGQFKNAIMAFNNYVGKLEINKPTVFIYDARHIIQILPFFGRALEFKIKGGVIEPLETGDLLPIWESPVGVMVEKFNIGYVSLDSLSAPIGSFFTGGQINYRPRGKTTQALLGRAQDLVDEYQNVFMITAHASINHTDPYADVAVVGGKAVLHNVKYIAFLERYKGKKVAKEAGLNWRNLRYLKIFRHPRKTPYSETGYIQTTPYGIKDFDRNKYIDGEEEEE